MREGSGRVDKTTCCLTGTASQALLKPAGPFRGPSPGLCCARSIRTWLVPPCCGEARRLSCLSPAAPGPRPRDWPPGPPGAAPCRAPKPHLVLLSRPAASSPLDLPQRGLDQVWGVGELGLLFCLPFPRGPVTLSLLEGRQQVSGESQGHRLHGLSSALSSREPAWVRMLQEDAGLRPLALALAAKLQRGPA